MILIMVGANLKLSAPRRAVSTGGESQKVTGVMNVSRRRLLFFIRRDPGRGKAMIKTLKKRGSNWEQMGAVCFQPRYPSYLLFFFILTIWNVVFGKDPQFQLKDKAGDILFSLLSVNPMKGAKPTTNWPYYLISLCHCVKTPQWATLFQFPSSPWTHSLFCLSLTCAVLLLETPTRVPK